MIWIYILFFFTAFIVGFFQLPSFIIFIAAILFIGAIFYLSFYPLFLEKDEKKIVAFLKKSKRPSMRFLYFLLMDEEEKAKEEINQIKHKEHKVVSQLLLLSKQKNYEEAKKLLPMLKETKYKWYYKAGIALEEGDMQTYAENKSLLKDSLLLSFLEIEQKRKSGEKEEALKMLENKIASLRGLNLLTALQYKKDTFSNKKSASVLEQL
ncbi:MAG: hypothetical protein ABF649_12030 [Bacillus sp. (in: firmicutes)]